MPGLRMPRSAHRRRRARRVPASAAAGTVPLSEETAYGCAKAVGESGPRPRVIRHTFRVTQSTHGKQLQVRSPVIGLAAAFVSAAIAAGWQVATRAGLTTGGLTAIDLALFRYGIPALVLLPLLLRHGLWPSSAPRWLAVPLLLGGGLPFGLIAMTGAQLAPVAHMGALLAGTTPLFTGLLAWLLLKERLTPRKLAGFVVVGIGIALIASTSLADFGRGTLAGDALFLLAALTWAVFTVAFRASDIPPWHAAALVSLASALVALPLWLATGTERLLAASAPELLWLAAMQGVLAGLAGFWSFAVAIRHLGAIGAALAGAMVPVLAAVGGVLFLSEVPGPLVLAGVAATVIGIVAVTWPLNQVTAPRMPAGLVRGDRGDDRPKR